MSETPEVQKSSNQKSSLREMSLMNPSSACFSSLISSMLPYCSQTKLLSLLMFIMLPHTTRVLPVLFHLHGKFPPPPLYPVNPYLRF